MRSSPNISLLNAEILAVSELRLWMSPGAQNRKTALAYDYKQSNAVNVRLYPMHF